MFEMPSPGSVTDKIRFLSNAATLRGPMVRTISAVQDDPPHLQILGIAAGLVALCEGIGHDPVDVIQQIRNAKSNIDTEFSTQWSAMVEYSKGELR